MFPSINYDESAYITWPTDGQLMLPADLDPMLAQPAHKLIERYAEVMHALNEIPDEDVSGRPQYSNHLAEDASDASEWQSRAAVTHHLANEMRQIERAYAMMQRGRYGVCEQCGHNIPPRRLSIVPSATFCVSCQERVDIAATGH